MVVNLLDVDPCGVWETREGIPIGMACGVPAVEHLVRVNSWMGDLPVCIDHLERHLREHLLY